MGTDFKRTFLAGAAVLFILLIAPYYLQLIGYQDSQEIVNEEPPSEIKTLNAPIDKNKPIQNIDIDRASVSDVQRFSFNIVSSKYLATINNLGGGSFEKYELINGGKQLQGGYDSQGSYNDSIDVSLMFNNERLCAPCVGVQEKGQQTILSEPFQLISIKVNNRPINNTKSVVLGEQDSCTVSLGLTKDNYRVIKNTTFFGNSYQTQHIANIQTMNNSFNQEGLSLVWDKGIKNTEKNLYDEITAYAAAYISINKETQDLWYNPGTLQDEAESIKATGPIEWAAIRNKYFIMAMIPEFASSAFLDAVPYELNHKNIVPSYIASISAGGVSTLSSTIYFGPLDIDYIHELDSSLDRIMNFGWYIIQPFSRGVLWLLKSMHSFGINYGIILILFAFLVRIITGPLTKKAFLSSQKMQTIQPQLQKLQTKYKNDSQRLNQEMVKLYKESGVNPLGGCLPMLMQMPLLLSLFLVFRSTIEFRGAPFFGWISNLSQPDTVFYLPFSVPIYGDQVALLPILLGISMFLSQRVSMSSMDPKQKPVMYIMSAFFFLLFNSFPSGLNLYYLVYNFLNYFQQKSLKKA